MGSRQVQCLRAGDRVAGGGEQGPGAAPRPGGVRHLPQRRRPSHAGSRHPPLPRRAAGPDRGTHRARRCTPVSRRAAHPFPEDATRRRPRRAPPGAWRCTGTTRAVGAAPGAGSLTGSRLGDLGRRRGTARWRSVAVTGIGPRRHDELGPNVSGVRGSRQLQPGGGRTGRPSCGVSKIGTSRAWSRCGGSPSASSDRSTPTSAPRLDRRASWSFVGPESAGCSRPTLRTTTRDGRIEHCSCARDIRKRPSPSRSTAESDVRPIVGG